MENDLFYFLEKRDIKKVISLLEENPALINSTNENGQTPFWLASAYGQTELLKRILNPPIKDVLDHTITDIWKRDALDAAYHFNHKAVIEILEPLFGVGLYHKIADKRLNPFLPFFSNLFDEFYYLISTYRFRSGIALASSLFLCFTVYNQWFSDSSERMIAKGEDDINIEKVALEQLKKERGDSLNEVIEKENYSRITFKMSIQQTKDKTLNTKKCIINIVQNDKAKEYTITAEEQKYKKPSITTNLDNLLTKYKSSKNIIITQAIERCF